MSNRQVITRDFSKKRPIINFTLDEDEFKCRKALDLPRLQKFIAEYRDGGAVDELRAVPLILETMKLVLVKESYDRFFTRFSPTEDVADDENFEPIDHLQVMDIIKWVMEQYTGRPTQPSSSSPAGLEIDDGGTPSTAGASHEESTSPPSTSETPST